MPTTLQETDAFDANVAVPNDLEDATAASLRDTFVQKLLNRTLYLYNRLSQMPVFKDGTALTVRKALDFLGPNVSVVDHPGTARTRVTVLGPYVTHGLVLEWAEERVIITRGCTPDNDEATAIHASAALSLNINAEGPGGLDEGVLPVLGADEAAWFEVHLIADSTGVRAPSAVFSSGGAFGPELPAGYDLFRYLGSVRLTEFGIFQPFTMFALGDTREVWYAEFEGSEYSDDVDRDDLLVLDGGAAGAWTEIDLSDHVPHVDTVAVMLDAAVLGGTTADFLVRVKGSLSESPPVRIAYGDNSQTTMIVSTEHFQRLEYKRAGGEDGALSLWVRGYRERLATGLGDS